MSLDIQFKLKINPKYIQYIRDHSYWYKILNRNPMMFSQFEEKVKEFNGDLTRSAVELAKMWRTEKMYQKLEAMLIVADSSKILLISGDGNVIEPENDVLAIGSGGNYAYSAALAYLDSSGLSAKEIAERSLKIAGSICIYTNNNITVEEL